MAAKSLLLVEGNDDKHVLWQLLEHHRVPERFEVRESGGLENEFKKIIEILDVVIDESDLEKLGIIVDANADPASRWQSLKDRLNNLGYNLPNDPDPEGTIIEQEGRPRIGIWLMPDNKAAGMLEDFVISLGAAADPLWSVAENCLNEIPDEHRRFKPSYRVKAHIHTWLAWQEEPGKPMGLAIKILHCLDANAPHARQLIDWIRRLFDL